MKKIKFTLLIVIISCSGLFAQQSAPNSLFNLNRINFNPAAAGASEIIPITLLVRQQWMGFDNAPRTQFLSVHSFLPYDIGLGGLVFNNISGPTRQTGLKFCFAKHLEVSKNIWLSLGLSAELYQYNFDTENLTTYDPIDPAISGAVFQKLAPDASTGVFLYSGQWYAGLSATNVLESKMDLLNSSSVFLNPIERTYYFNGGYKFIVNNSFAIEPSVLVKKMEATPVQADFNTLFFYKSVLSGFSVRSNLDAVVLLGFRIAIFEILYSFDYSFSELRQYNNGSQQIALRFTINNEVRKQYTSQKRGYQKQFEW